MTARLNRTIIIAGLTLVQSISVSAKAAIPIEISIPAANTGTLTTRTSNSVGTFTMTSGGHTITTAARVDIYWATGSRRGVTVGTVAGTSVPFTGGSGDNLPASSTVCTVALSVVQSAIFTGNTVQAAALYTPKRGTFVFTQSDDTELLAKVLDDGRTFDWHTNASTTDATPFAGAFAKLYLSHSSTSAQTMRAVVCYN